MQEEEIVIEIRKWLGEKGTKFFRDVKEKHGTIIACWDEGGIPHPVHFREGMQVRNKLRQLTNNAWTDHEYDDKWAEVIEKAILI